MYYKSSTCICGTCVLLKTCERVSWCCGEWGKCEHRRPIIFPSPCILSLMTVELYPPSYLLKPQKPPKCGSLEENPLCHLINSFFSFTSASERHSSLFSVWRKPGQLTGPMWKWFSLWLRWCEVGFLSPVWTDWEQMSTYTRHISVLRIYGMLSTFRVFIIWHKHAAVLSSNIVFPTIAPIDSQLCVAF